MKIFWWFAGALILFKLWLVGGHDLLAKFRYYDDSLFLEHAQNLLNGNWFGELDYRTLIKGPGYPLFIAAAYWAGVPLLTAQQLLYIIACLVAIYALRGIVKSSLVLGLFFLVLLFNPFSYFYPMVGALMRESVYNSFSLMFLAAMLGLWQHHGKSFAIGLVWSLLMSFAFSMLWLTREETIWTVPGMVLFALLFLPSWRWNKNTRLLSRMTLLAIPVVAAGASIYGIVKINAAYYGAPVFIETKSTEFTSALGSLMNIREDKFKKGRIVGPQSRKAAFRVSPTFASLKPYIEKRSKKRPNVFFNWTLRSAVNEAGYYSDPHNIQPALDVYSKIGNEISTACENGEIRCFDRSAALLPPLYPEHIAKIPDVFQGLLMDTVGFRGVNAESAEFSSRADMGMLMTFDYVTGESAVRKSIHFTQMRPAFASDMVERKEGLMVLVGKSYQTAMPFLLMAALVAHLVSLVTAFRQGAHTTAPLFGLILGGSIFGILVILTYVKVTLFNVPRPITVVYPLVLLYVVTMLGAVFSKKTRQ